MEPGASPRLGYMLKKETTMRVAFVALCLACVGGTRARRVKARPDAAAPEGSSKTTVTPDKRK
jgi:hypothetical protein